MYIHRTLFALLLLLSTTFYSCKKDNEEPENGDFSSEVVYLKVGHKWIYNVIGPLAPYDTYSQEFSSVSKGIFTVSNQYDNETPFTNKAYYENGYLNNMGTAAAKAPNQQFLKYKDVHLGDTWTRVTPTETYYYKVVGLNETVTVPAGTFICKKIEITFKNASNTQYSYFSDTSGLIMVDNEELFNLELKSKNF